MLKKAKGRFAVENEVTSVSALLKLTVYILKSVLIETKRQPAPSLYQPAAPPPPEPHKEKWGTVELFNSRCGVGTCHRAPVESEDNFVKSDLFASLLVFSDELRHLGFQSQCLYPLSSLISPLRPLVDPLGPLISSLSPLISPLYICFSMNKAGNKSHIFINHQRFQVYS